MLSYWRAGSFDIMWKSGMEFQIEFKMFFFILYYHDIIILYLVFWFYSIVETNVLKNLFKFDKFKRI